MPSIADFLRSTKKSEEEIRTVESITDALLIAISGEMKISGEGKGGPELIKITRRHSADWAFKNRLEEIAHTILEEFPNPGMPESAAPEEEHAQPEIVPFS